MNSKTPHRQSYFHTFLRRGFVLRQMGRLTQADIEQVRQAAMRLRTPEAYLPQIDELTDRNTSLVRY